MGEAYVGSRARIRAEVAKEVKKLLFILENLKTFAIAGWCL